MTPEMQKKMEEQVKPPVEVLHLGDSFEVLRGMEDNSIDSVVTDPPYGLKFMGKKWDHDVPSVELWREVLSVLKPGGHLLSFGGTRTYHRMVVAIEDAGFEIRDQIQWIYGSGFPKSHNLKGEWQGFGTALKPANEPIVLARKPLEKGLTVAANVLKWGVGGLNIEGCRVGDEIIESGRAGRSGNVTGKHGIYEHGAKPIGFGTAQGRWPANVIFDEEAGAMLDGQSDDKKGVSRFFYCAKAAKSERNAGLEGMPEKQSGVKNASGRGFSESDPYKKVVNQNHHPTVKPVQLMRYLVRLVTPPGGTVLDPFMGSGTTGVACKSEGFGFIGIELNPEYLEIAKGRIGAVAESKARRYAPTY
jgi:DNA modification methylase